jgi:hypothetical protein
MRFRQIALLVAFAVMAIVIACKNDATGPDTDLGNLLTNGSFESNSKATWNSWVLRDTPLDTTTLFYQDAPPLGGTWALKLQYHPPDIGWARAYFTDTYAFGAIYRFTVWGKAVNGWPNGFMAMGKISAGITTYLKSKTITNESWTQYVVEDTFDLAREDSLFVQVSAGGDYFPLESVRFDLARLEKIR